MKRNGTTFIGQASHNHAMINLVASKHLMQGAYGAKQDTGLNSNSKRTALLLIRICLLTFFFVLIAGTALSAGAVYRGFTPLNPTDTLPGYLSWNMAVDVMQGNNVDATLQSSAHGGYITTTTKCIVCHSPHRALGIPTGTPGPQNQYFLTSGGSSCTNCHANFGSQSSGLMVEWGQPGGPHNSRGGCLACHQGGIHGGSNSQFHVMNVFMLGNEADAQLQAEAAQLALGPNSALWVPPALTAGVNENPTAANTPTTGNTWWYDGGASVNSGARVGGPTQLGGLPGEQAGSAALVNAAQYSAARSVATSYVCSQDGCHVNTVMANLQWGVGFNRDVASDGTTVAVTAHTLPAIMRTNGAYNGNNQAQACGPCHVGTPAGFPTDGFSVSRVAYGCDQCHDMVGVATNSTAWPHGNRNIRVYEWEEVSASGGGRDINRYETTMTAGNLWMYSGNIARIATGPFDPADPTGNRPAANSAYGQSGTFADVNWKVLRGVTNGRGNTVATAHSGADITPGFGGLNDGGCLKCHVPIDGKSLDALGASAGDATRHNFNFTLTGPTRTGSQRLFLYR